MLTLASTIMASFLAAGAPANDASAMLQQHADASLTARSNAVEVVYADGKYSHLEYRSTTLKPSEPYLPADQRHRIESPRLAPFGACTSVKGGILRRSDRPCGLLVDLSVGKTSLDLLGFDTVNISGAVTGRWTLALADEYLAGTEENRPFGELRAGGATSFPLSRVASRLDLKRSKLLAFILDSPSGTLTLDRIEFAKTKTATTQATRPAIWMWDNQGAMSDPARVASDLGQMQVRRVYLQIGDTLDPLASFLRECRARGIEVYALDGSPDYVEHPAPLLARARMVRDFNVRVPDAPFAGFQIDVEPHLNKDFSIRFEEYGRRYADLVDRLRDLLGDKTPLSTVIPFWYDTLQLDGRSLAWHLISRSSEAVIMSYRTDMAEVESVARDELAYGEHLDKPILLGIETVRIPDELHIVYHRCPQDAPQSVAAGGAAWCRRSDYSVQGSRLSFYGKGEAFRQRLGRTLPSPAFAGWVIHSYESYPR